MWEFVIDLDSFDNLVDIFGSQIEYDFILLDFIGDLNMLDGTISLIED
jgi:hypothetical protein